MIILVIQWAGRMIRMKKTLENDKGKAIKTRKLVILDSVLGSKSHSKNFLEQFQESKNVLRINQESWNVLRMI